MADLEIWLSAASGLLFVALGVLVLFVRPRRKANVVFAGFAVAWGARHFLANLAGSGRGVEAVDLMFYLAAAAQLAATVALVWLTLIFPNAPLRAERNLFWVAGGVGLAYVPLSLGLLAWEGNIVPAAAAQEGAQLSTFLVFIVTFNAMIGAHLYAILLWTLRYLYAPADDGRARRQYALLTAALVAWIGFISGAGPAAEATVMSALRTGNVPLLLAAAAPLLVLAADAVLWLYAQHARPDGNIGRNMAWFVLAVPLLGVVAWYTQPVGGWALTRVVGFALLAIAILRFQLLTIDVKIRWTVSRSTVAAAFIVVFFVASEAAAAFFGDNFQNDYLGIAAAALLVLVLVPLQRLADRLAAKAVPGPGGLFEPARAERTYRNAVRMALANRQIEAEEEVQLAELADGLGISGARAMEIRNEVAAGKARGE